MATITTDTFLDGGVARTAGETWTCNGGKLIIRTDSRWHANAPAAMTGSLGSVTVSSTLGGGYEIDATAVRWLPFDAGSGNVPAIGTTITGGTSGANGYLLGVWASLTSAPTAVGAAMPATGFIKLREADAAYVDNDVLSGIGATANGADVQGWIEVVHLQTSNLTFPRLGTGFVTRGDWFYLDNTNGSAGQQIQIPTNGGGAGTLVPGVWIETSPGSGVYEQYPAITVAVGFNTTNYGTDARSKVVEAVANGIIRIGSDGTNNIGYVPPSGCKVRIPNIIGRQCVSGTDALNANPHATRTSRPEFATSTGGAVDIDGFICDWYCNFQSPYAVTVKHLCTVEVLNVSNCATAPWLEDGFNGIFTVQAVVALSVGSCLVGGTVRDWKAVRGDALSSGYCISFINCVGFDIDDITAIQQMYARNSNGFSVYFTLCLDCDIDGINQYNSKVYVSSSSGCAFKNIDHVDRIVGTTNATTGLYMVSLVNSSNCLVDGITFGMNGAIANVHPYSGVFYTTGNSGDIRLRNAGTIAAPLSGGTANSPASCYASGGNDTGVKVNNVWVDPLRSQTASVVVTSKDIIVENCGSMTTAHCQQLGVNSKLRGVRALQLAYAQSSVFGQHTADVFLSDTVGEIDFVANESTATTAPYVSLTLGGFGGFTSAGMCAMPTLGDELIIEMDYFALAHTAFANSAPTVGGTNTGNFSVKYQVDLNDGNGWNGTWTDLTGGNLSALTLDPSLGVKLKVQFVCTIADATNAIRGVQIPTVSTLVAQSSYQYPMDVATITLTGLTTNSRVQLYDMTNDVELYNDIVADTTLEYEAEYTADSTIQVRVMYQNGTLAKEFYETTGTLVRTGLDIAVTQENDSIYTANAVDGSAVTGIEIVDGTFLVEVDTGTVSLQEIYAYETYWLYTEEGIRDETRFITAIDQANYIFKDFKIKNVQAGVLPLVITGGYMKDSVTEEAIDVIDTSGGTIFLAPEHVTPFTPENSVTVTDLEVINRNVQKASLLIPATEDL